MTPSESVISYHTWPSEAGSKPKVQGVAALTQGSTSAIVTLKKSGLDKPAKLDGKVYASYGARFEVGAMASRMRICADHSRQSRRWLIYSSRLEGMAQCCGAHQLMGVH